MFILPSNREGIGSILLDAMDRGLPVIASRVGGVPDIVHDDHNGILIDRAVASISCATAILRSARRRGLGGAVSASAGASSQVLSRPMRCRKKYSQRSYAAALGRRAAERDADQSALHHRGP